MKMLRYATLPSLALVLLLAVACSSSDSSDESTPGPTAAATMAATAGATTEAMSSPAPSSEAEIKLGFSAWPGWFPWEVTKEAGIFDEVGVNVDLVWFEGYLDSINALAAGQLYANSQTLNDTIASVAAGSDQVIVLVNDNSTGNDQIIATSDITTIEDLAGKKIGIEAGVVDHFLLAQGLQSVGLTLDDVEVVNLETGAAAASFAAGQLDAVGVFAPFTTQALKRAGSRTLFTSADFPGSIPDHLVVSRALVTDRPDDVERLIRAWFKTLDYIAANPDEALAIMAERAGVSTNEYKEYDAGTTLFSLADNTEAFSPGTDFKSLAFAADEISSFLMDNGFIDAKPDLTKLLDGQFVEIHASMQ